VSNLIPVFASPKARINTPVVNAPDRRAAEPSDTGFARSLATVRGLERNAAGHDRAVQARLAARRDDRSDERAEMRSAADQTTPVRSRDQVQALMLSGAMKFAATRSTDVATPQADAQAAAVSPPLREDLTSADDSRLPAADAPSTRMPADVLASIVSAPHAARGDDRPSASVAEAVIDAGAPATSAGAAAMVAAMQLVAMLPLSEAAPVIDQMPEQMAAFTGSSANEDSQAALNRRLTALQAVQGEGALVEDHFDAPAKSATSVAVTTDFATTPATAATVRHDPTRTNERTASSTTTPATTTTPVIITRASVPEMERDIAQLTPEFRQRLQRVMERMRLEFGHEVTIVETVRSPERQAALFAQGRTTPGPVVTWTRDSKHSKGLAADLMVDGKWENPLGYAHLQLVAKQEGLRTLGARDPGHVELSADGSVSAETLGALLGDLGGEAGDDARKVRADMQQTSRDDSAAAMARVANVAQVARVSSVSQVARVATVARPEAAGSRAESGGNEAVSPLASSGPMPAYMVDGSAAARLAAPVGNVNMADRISQLMDLQASQAAKPMNSMLLRMDNATGIEDQIRIDMRGTSVDARLGLGSAQQAADLGSRVSELREALERRGLAPDELRVQAAPRTTDSVNFSRTTAPAIEVAAMRAAAESQTQGGPRDQTSRDQQHREAMAREQERPNPRPSSDDARHRSRREQPETRQ